MKKIRDTVNPVHQGKFSISIFLENKPINIMYSSSRRQDSPAVDHDRHSSSRSESQKKSSKSHRSPKHRSRFVCLFDKSIRKSLIVLMFRSKKRSRSRDRSYDRDRRKKDSHKRSRSRDRHRRSRSRSRKDKKSRR